MSCMFCGFFSLQSLPDISKWDTKNVTNMNHMFQGCSSLSSLPDISKWNINNLKEYKGMFDNCKKSLKIPINIKMKMEGKIIEESSIENPQLKKWINY